MAKENPIASTKYKNCLVEVHLDKTKSVLSIDGKPVEYRRDGDTGAYHPVESPYEAFASLEEMGKAVVDVRESLKGAKPGK